MEKLIPLITVSSLLLVVGCDAKFSSMTQAVTACEKWAEDEGWNKQNQNAFRICENEKETSQILGYEQDMSEIEPTNEPIKHFRY
tara:strand:+ start:315 stop:569 length:255 start_codon:yes stop_codon:yes gene_type:complete